MRLGTMVWTFCLEVTECVSLHLGVPNKVSSVFASQKWLDCIRVWIDGRPTGKLVTDPSYAELANGLHNVFCLSAAALRRCVRNVSNTTKPSKFEICRPAHQNGPAIDLMLIILCFSQGC